MNLTRFLTDVRTWPVFATRVFAASFRGEVCFDFFSCTFEVAKEAKG